MEGTLDNRLVLTRPTSRPVAPRNDGVLQIDHTPAPVVPAEVASIAPAAPAAPIAPTASVAPIESVVAPAPVIPTPVAPQFSQLTPIYQPTPTNTPADIAGPRVKGLDFVKVPTPAKPLVTAPAQTTAPRPVSAAASLQNALPEAMVIPADLPMPPTMPSMFGPQKIEYLEKNLDTVDLDQMEGVVNDAPMASVAPTVPVAAAAPQPFAPVAPTQTSSAIEPAVIAPASVAPQTDFVQQYFQQGPAEAAPVKRSLASFIPVPKMKFSFKNLDRKVVRRAGVLSLLTGIIAIGGYVVADSFFVNQQAKEVLAQDTSNSVPAESPALTESAPAAAETTTTTTPAQDTSAAQVAQASQQVPATANSGVSYAVPADQPRYLTIKKLGIHAPVVSLGLTTGGAVDTPKNIWNAGWYNGSAKPGNDGATLIDGHSSASHGALFGNLDKLAAGDQIQVERGDGTVLTYKIAYTTIVNRNSVDMGSMMKPYGGAAKGLNIITCTGKWIDAEKTLENRVLVYAQQI